MSGADWAISVAVGGFVIVIGIALFHALMGLRRVQFDGAAPPGFWLASMREVPAFLRIAVWGVSGRPRLQPEDVDADAAVVVLLVHGALTDGTCTTGWKNALALAGVNAPILCPDHGILVRSLDVHAHKIRAFIRRIHVNCPQAKLVLVGHSLGGLVIRKLLHSDDELCAATLGVVSVASPHGGTQSLRGFGRRATMATRMRALETLVTHSVFIASAVDAIVYPKTTSFPLGPMPAQGCSVWSFDQVGHAALLVHPEVSAQIALSVLEMMAHVDG